MTAYPKQEAWYTRNRERMLAYKRRYYHDDKRRAKNNTYKRKYGITLDAWEAMFAAQGFCCAACKAPEPGSSCGWHTHHTGDGANKKVHGILCHYCNLPARQGTRETIAQLRALAEYLERQLEPLQ